MIKDRVIKRGRRMLMMMCKTHQRIKKFKEWIYCSDLIDSLTCKESLELLAAINGDEVCLINTECDLCEKKG